MANKEYKNLNKNLLKLNQLFHSPPLSKELINAILLTAPQFDLSLNKKSQILWEKEQNAACWGEYLALKPLFDILSKPKKILEIGPGLGRSLVFFTKKLGWQESRIDAFEGEGRTTKYTLMGPRSDDSYCGNLSLLRSFLDFNQINNVYLFDASLIKLDELPGPYDLIYSFYAIGFHWSLEHFLFDILHLMHERSIALFTIPSNFEAFPQLDAFFYQMIDYQAAWPKKTQLKILILSKSPLPKF